MPRSAESPLAVLVVCTANICRSPMAEALLRHRASASELAIEASSAGFLFDGESPTDDTVAVMAEIGLDVSDHRSRVVRPEMVRASDLVVTMERTHARALAVDYPEAANRVHTLGAAVDGLSAISTGDAPERIDRLGRERGPADLLGGGDDEVEDPFGRSLRFHRRTVERLDEMVADLVAVLAGS